jgi:hypothetical protein
MLGFALVVGPWMARNAARFDTLSLAGRSGLVMTVRANLNELPPEHYRYAYVYFSNIFGSSRAARATAPPEVKRFFEDRKRGFRGRGYSRQSKVRRKYKLSTPEVDEFLKKEAQGRILANFSKNLLMVPPVMLRGLTSERGIGFLVLKRRVVGSFGEKYFGVNLSSAFVSGGYYGLAVGGALFVSLVGLAIYGLRGGRFNLFLFTCPALYLIALQALVTHFIPRYGLPILPVQYACLCIALAKVGSLLARRVFPARSHAPASLA